MSTVHMPPLDEVVDVDEVDDDVDEELDDVAPCWQPPATQSPSLKAMVSALAQAPAIADSASAAATKAPRCALLFSRGDVMSAGVAS
jgi:hypothetical protein